MDIHYGILQLIIGLCAIMVGGLIVYFVINYNIKKEKEKKRKGNKIRYTIMRYKYKVRELEKETSEDMEAMSLKKLRKKVRP